MKREVRIEKNLKRIITTTALVIVSFSVTHAQESGVSTTVRDPAEVINAYVDAANHNNLEAFLALYAPGIKKYRFPATLASEGIEHMRKVYTKSFAEKSGIHVEIRSMIVLGDKVMCYDHVTGLPNGEEADETVIYQVENGLITNIIYVERLVKNSKKN